MNMIDETLSGQILTVKPKHKTYKLSSLINTNDFPNWFTKNSRDDDEGFCRIKSSKSI